MIRQMREADLMSVYRITCNSLDEYYASDVFSYFMLRWPAGQLVAVDPVGNVVGYMTASRLGKGVVTITLFAVDPSYRNHGVGDELLRAFRHRSTMEGHKSIQLEVRANNAAAIAFYSKRGFLQTSRLPCFYNDGCDALRMIAPVLMNM